MDKRNNTVDRIIDINGLAEILSIKKGTIYSHLSRGNDLPPYFRVGSQTRWRESVVWQWIEKKEKERKRKNFEE
jgi:predicted DNA-binding transcriptional regulator AlpA